MRRRRDGRFKGALRAAFRSSPGGEKAWDALGRAVRRVLPVPPPGLLPAAVQPAAPGAGEDFYFFGVIDWHFRFQRPQHLALGLAERGHRVFYVSPTFVDDATPGFRVERVAKGLPVYQIFLHVAGTPLIYEGPPEAPARMQLVESLSALRRWTGGGGGICLLQHPFWFGVAYEGRDVRLVYDCLDHHEGFETFGAAMVEIERRLMAAADLLIVSSAWLDGVAAAYSSRRILLRNAADFGHFSRRPDGVFEDAQGRRIIGYYGAIANWFDVDLVVAVARRFATELVVLIGGDQCGATERLASIPNVMLVGEVPYRDLPFYLHAFDVCLLPFVVSDLTLATNPVKVYEYLSAGKEVVSVDLPEMRQFGSLVRVAGSTEGFLEAIDQALTRPAAPDVVAQRKAMVATQTWQDRVDSLIAAVRRIEVGTLAEGAPAG